VTADPRQATGPALVSLAYAGAFVDQLVAGGMRLACICPGSRSTPLALAIAAHPEVRSIPLVDERSAAFFALGAAKATGRPTAVVSTSGTAAANFYPAIVEGLHSHTPLLALTADRPHELRGAGALQAIDQIKLYGSQVKGFVEMAPPDEVNRERYARDVARQGLELALRAPAGPVHFNFPFAEPLVPPAGSTSRVEEARGRPLPVRALELPDSEASELAAAIRKAPRGLIVCGAQEDPGLRESVLQLAQAAGYPILADPLSQVRFGPSGNALIVDSYDLILRSEMVSAGLRPDLVLRFGLTPTSKPLLTYLERHADARQITVNPGGSANDPLRVTRETMAVDPPSFCRSLLRHLDGRPAADAGWLESWRSVSSRCRLVVDAHLAAMTELCEPRVFAELREALAEDVLLFVGNSMPVRDCDAFFAVREPSLRSLGNRGVNGIDGVVSTALGAGAAVDRRVVLVIGDLSFYHDLNGLLAAKLQAIDATVVLLNNDGGGIFHFLPQAEHESVFERYFATPTGLDFAPAVEMYGGVFRRPQTWPQVRAEIDESLRRPGLTVVEIRTDRERNAALHRQIWSAVTEALSAGLPF